VTNAAAKRAVPPQRPQSTSRAESLVDRRRFWASARLSTASTWTWHMNSWPLTRRCSAGRVGGEATRLESPLQTGDHRRNVGFGSRLC